MLYWNIHVNMHCWNFGLQRVVLQSSGVCKICSCCNTLLFVGILVPFICINFLSSLVTCLGQVMFNIIFKKLRIKMMDFMIL
jgi:hypothetical protein